ncbi:MAG: hypothetical protein ACE37F_31520 [Nannocystaceae bacterium]|nr:hypothetical protein [bacterium]
MVLPPIKLRLGGEDVHLVPQRALERWGGFLNGGRAAFGGDGDRERLKHAESTKSP